MWKGPHEAITRKKLLNVSVYDINTGSSHRLEHVSMQPEPENVNLTIGGSTYLFDTPVDGIALSPDKTLLHYSALGRIPEYTFVVVGFWNSVSFSIPYMYTFVNIHIGNGPKIPRCLIAAFNWHCQLSFSLLRLVCEILTSNYCSNRKLLEFNNENTKAKMVQCDHEFFMWNFGRTVINFMSTQKQYFSKNISVKPAELLMLGTWRPCN